jgi:hypothetical protein
MLSKARQLRDTMMTIFSTRSSFLITLFLPRQSISEIRLELLLIAIVSAAASAQPLSHQQPIGVCNDAAFRRGLPPGESQSSDLL